MSLAAAFFVKEHKMSLGLVEKWYWSLGVYERNTPLVPLGRTFYTPTEVLSDVRKDTTLGRDLQSQLEALRKGASARLDPALLWDMAKMRLIKRLTERPSTFISYHMDHPILTAKEFIQLVIAETDRGRRFIETEIDIVKSLWKV